ncbi:MAG: signal peptidase I [Phycisphaerae bacterium]|nr:signal peptidase I [Phycisphaerae bacterium]
MTDASQQTIDYPMRRRSTTVEGIANTLELVVTALILAFVFRAFVVEAFRIPTGSMAETLRGAHYHLRCIRCGFPYDVGGDSWSIPKPRCSSCGYDLPVGMGVSISNGDRILVLKGLYQFLPPKRWDVIVFKNPVDPRENYIKRLIALPEETVEIIDGDIYIDGRIARKPPKVQEELWMPIYNNDYQMLRGRILPTGNSGPRDENPAWGQPFENDPNAAWNLNAKGPTVFSLDSAPGPLHWMVYNSRVGNDFRSSYAYNDGSEHYLQPVCSDLMIRFDVTNRLPEGVVGAALTKYGVEYRATVDFAGVLALGKTVDGAFVELARRETAPVKSGRSRRFQFANVDHQLVLSFGGETLRYDLGSAPGDLGDASLRGTPAVKIMGSGALTLWHISLYRDIHYISERILRAAEGDPFTLGPDEFFACGDNSPCSLDSRLWATAGIGNSDVQYTKGVVPRDYLMGKAFFVYWSDAFKPLENLLPIIPNMGGVQLIYGGSDKQF